MACVLDLPIGGNELAAEGRDPRAAPACPADARRRDRLGQRVIQIVEQQPCSAIAHAELTGGLGQRARRLDALEQRDLAGTDGAPRTEIDPQPHTESAALLAHAAMLAHCEPRGPRTSVRCIL